MKTTTITCCYVTQFLRKISFLGLAVGAIIVSDDAFAQSLPVTPDPIPYPVTEINKIAKEVRSDGYVYFNDDFEDKPDEVLKKRKAAFGLEASDETVLNEVLSLEGGVQRYRYRQLHLGIPVEGADFSIYAKDKHTHHAAGPLAHGLGASAETKISEKDALRLALEAVKATRYYWQDTQQELALRQDTGNPLATYYPSARLVYTRTPESFRKKVAQYRLAYRYEIYAAVPYGQWAVYVDAANGEIVNKTTLLSDCFNGTVTTVYNGVQTIQTDQRPYSPYNYLLEDWCRGAVIASKYSNFTNDCWSCTNYIYWGSNNSWDNTLESRLTASAHWSMEKAHDYFASLGRSNNNTERRIQVDFSAVDQYGRTYYPTNYSRSDSDNKDYFHIGRAGAGNTSLAELDIVAHEFGHSVTRATGVLGYEQESGALNESFSDIFGLMTERSVYGTMDWVLGGRTGFTRYFANLGTSTTGPQAQYYQSTSSGWQNVYDPNDFGGVHVNAGVQNRWFYLISVGGSGSRGPVVPAIGVDKAARISYAALTGYLFQYANYPDSRAATIQAAKNIYGECSLEVEAVTKAWYGVGVGDPFPTVCASVIQGQTSYCLEDGPSVYATYTVQASPGATKTWSVNNPDWGFTQVGDYFELTSVPDYVSSAIVTVVVTINGNSKAITKTVSTRACSACRLCPVQKTGGNALSANVADNANNVVIFPNPATRVLNVSLPISDRTTTITATDVVGRKWSEHTVLPGTKFFEMEVSGMPAGMYQLVISDGQRRVTHRVQIIK